MLSRFWSMLGNHWLSFVARKLNLEAYAYVCFSLSYTELTADQFSARVGCQSTDYSSMWCAQRTFPLTVAYRHWQDLKMGSDFPLITHIQLKGYLIAAGIAQTKPTVEPTRSLLHKGHRGFLAAGAWNWPLNPHSVEVRNEWNFTSISTHAFMTSTGTNLLLTFWSLMSTIVVVPHR